MPASKRRKVVCPLALGAAVVGTCEITLCRLRLSARLLARRPAASLCERRAWACSNAILVLLMALMPLSIAFSDAPGGESRIRLWALVAMVVV